MLTHSRAPSTVPHGWETAEQGSHVTCSQCSPAADTAHGQCWEKWEALPALTTGQGSGTIT